MEIRKYDSNKKTKKQHTQGANTNKNKHKTAPSTCTIDIYNLLFRCIYFDRITCFKI